MSEDRGMHVLFFATRINGCTTRLNRILEDLFPCEEKEHCASVEALARRLKRPMGRLVLGVFLVADSRDLSDLLLLREDLRDVRFILILPDTRERTLSRAHALGPRYISYADSDFEDVAAVMKRMMETLRARQAPPPGCMEAVPGQAFEASGRPANHGQRNEKP